MYMRKIRRILLFLVLLIFNAFNIAVTTGNPLGYDYTDIVITLFYLFLGYLVYKEWKYTSVVAAIGYFLCVWLSQTYGTAWFGWFGFHIGLTILLIILFEVKVKCE